MQVALANKDKVSMLFLGGGMDFTYDDPGPRTIDLSTLTTEQKAQLFYNWKRGVLAVDNEDELKSLCATPTPPPKSYAFTTDAQPVAQPKDIDEALKARETKLKGILRLKVAAIKKELPGLTSSELRGLIELEKQLKNRQKLLALLEEYTQKAYKAVGSAVGTEDVGKKVFNPSAQALDNSMDVVESDLEDVTLIPSDKELAKENG
jgi:hypothetical protein